MILWGWVGNQTPCGCPRPSASLSGQITRSFISTVRCHKGVDVEGFVRRGTTRRNADVVVGLGWEPTPVRLSASFRVSQRPDHEIFISTVRCHKGVDVDGLVRRGTTRRNADVVVGLGWEPNPVRLSASFRVTQRPDHEIFISTVRCRKRGAVRTRLRFPRRSPGRI